MERDPLASLAERGREAREREQTDAAAAAKQREAAVEETRDARLHAAFGTRSIAGWVTLTSGMIALFSAVALFEDGAILLGIVALVVGAVVSLALFLLVTAALTQRGNRWMRSMPFEFDHLAYLDQLARAHLQARVVVRVRFRAPLAPEVRQLVTDALVGASGEGRAVDVGEELQIVSPMFVGRRFRTDTVGDKYDLSRQHRWFVRLADRGLRAVHVRSPIAGITVAIE